MPSRPLSPSTHHKTRLHAIILAAIATASSILLLFLLVLLLFYLYSTLLRRSPTLPFFDSPSSVPLRPLRRFSHRHLRSATRAFDPSRSLGRGASAAVFRGILPDGKSVAVKRLDLHSPDREFQNELRVLASLPPSPFIVTLLGYCLEGHRRLLVYEYMCNGSLQEALFGGGHGGDLTWDRRFAVVLDVAQALAFLHLECDPPVVHGDIKPSNVLLGPDFRAKISDFGLSRIKSDAEPVVVPDLFSQELSPSQELGLSCSPHVDFAFTHHHGSSSKACNDCNPKIAAMGDGGLKGQGSASPKGKETAAAMTHYGEELNGSSSPLEEARTESKRQWGKDWWWKQEGSGELSSKDYVREWIGSQICPSRNPDWDDERKSSPENCLESTSSNRVDKSEAGDETLFMELGSNANEKPKPKSKPERKTMKGSGDSDGKSREMREWWKEEYFAEISNKGSSKGGSKRLKWFRTQSTHVEESIAGKCNAMDLKLDISFRKGWKKKRSRSAGSEMWSGDLFSKELSSTTTSMRGTVCYVAPEYGGCGHFMERSDIYSFGVLILVIVSGRRPLHVLSSPMELEKANLISWCRQLVHSGNVLDLVDERLGELYNKEQATLCINLALSCLQRMPELRPDSGDIVKILRGEMELPAVPFEFSPSPPSKPFSKSRRKTTLIEG